MPAGARLSNSSQKRFADRFLTPENWSKLEQLESFAQEHGRSILDVAFGWLGAKPFIPSIIAGASTPEQLDLNARAVGWVLTVDQIAHIDTVIAGKGVT